MFRIAFFALKRRAAGIDPVDVGIYKKSREENLQALHRRVHT
jgi:hypothetical protein